MYLHIYCIYVYIYICLHNTSLILEYEKAKKYFNKERNKLFKLLESGPETRWRPESRDFRLKSVSHLEVPEFCLIVADRVTIYIQIVKKIERSLDMLIDRAIDR